MFLNSSAIFAAALDFSPDLSDASKNFLEKFCISMLNGCTLNSWRKFRNQLAKGILFLPIINEIMPTSKEILGAPLSADISEECTKNLGVTKRNLTIIWQN